MNIIEKLSEYDKLYFESGTSPITDTEYDILKSQAKKEFPDDPYFTQVGYKSKYKTIKLPFVMGGLDKVDIETVNNWANKKSDSIFTTEKLDGNSILATWENGKLVFAASRGDENEGQDILEKAQYFIPKIQINGRITLRGEVVLEGTLHEYFGFKNRRNGVAGLLRRDEIIPNDLKFLSVIFYEVVECPIEIPSEVDRLQYIKNILNLRIPRYFLFENDPALPDLLSEVLHDCKGAATYDIDGLVLTFNHSQRENVAYPKNKVKFKVNEEAKKCKVLDIEWNVTRMGFIKPVILIEPTEIMGVTVSRASGFNYQTIVNSEIGRDSIIGVVRSGDVVPYVTEVFEKAEFVVVPNLCPTCNGKLEVIGKELVCNNPDCYFKNTKQVAHFFISMGCEGMSDKTIENIGITSIKEMYELTQEYLENLPGFAKKKAKKILSEVKKTLKVKPKMLLDAFGIPLIGTTISEELCKKFTIDELFEIKDPDKLGLGPITSKTFIDNIGKYRELYDYLKSIGLEFEKVNMESNTLTGMSFELTGKGPMGRDEIKSLIENKGGEVKGISKNTTYLVTNDPESKSGKMKNAVKLGVPVISYTELFEKFLY